MYTSAVLSSGLLLLLLPLAALAQDTTGQKVNHAPGYTFGSNVEGEPLG